MTNSSNISLSCEFFPTNTEQGAEKLAVVRKELTAAADFEYFSVTYGAGGSSQERTINLVKRIAEEQSINPKNPKVIAHLTCVAASRNSLIELLENYKSIAIAGILALRGDMPANLVSTEVKNEVENACALVKLTRSIWSDAHIAVACYPEIHPKAKTVAADIAVLKAKADAGANEAVSQYFFNPDSFLRFRDDAVRAGVQIPLTPGIMPITNYRQIADFSDKCGAELPSWIRKRLADLEQDQAALCEFGVDVVAKLCERLISEGVSNLHFYSMNKSEAVLQILRAVGLCK
ncbi:MAG: methylenetetrahydrofolate reductase [Cardiobacteriaceae bacterium]|nr:methylenetetrahydrofolate reductase [Cardiobacteriaceae bacterium]